MSLNLTTFGRLAALILCFCLTSSAPAELINNQPNNRIVTTGIAPAPASESGELADTADKVSPCLTGLCPLGVWALCEYNGDLYAGGDFTSADGQPTKFIARWDGSQWHDVGGGMNHYVRDLLVYDGKLIAGGVFDTVNGEPMGHVAAWDGVSWTPLGEGINRRPGITDMIVYDGDLIVAGTFDSAGSVASPNMAKWNGTSWEAFGPGDNIGFRTMIIFQGNLIGNNAPGGGFSKWDGSSWTTISTPINGGVYCLDVYNDQLIAGGFFVTAGEDTVNHIIAWDGANWTGLDGGIGPEYAKGSNVSVQSLFNFQNDLIVGGNFTLAGGDTANYIARWDGSSWHPIGGGMGGSPEEDHWVTALSEYNGALIAAGFFTTADDVIVNRIAAWKDDTWRPLTAQEGMPFAIEIDNDQGAATGATVSVPVKKIAGSSKMYGFDLLISYDSTYASFIDADPGVLFDPAGDYQWEYFNYRADTGFIRIVGLAETNNGAHHPLSGDIPNGTELFNLNFTGGDVGMFGFETVDLGFYWLDCGDNAILADSLGYDLVVSDSVYDADRVNVTDHGAAFPNNTGAPDECLGGGPTPVVRFVDFYGGHFFVSDTTPYYERGDINDNGLVYEIADEVMFINFMMDGFSAFYTHSDASTRASDINADGIPLRLEDLMFMHRVICDDTVPADYYPGGPVSVDTAVFIQDIATNTISVESPHTLGGVFLRFEGEIITDFYPIVDTSAYIQTSTYDGEYTRVLIFPAYTGSCQDTGFSPGNLFTYTGYGRLVEHFDPMTPGWDSPQAADYDGGIFINRVRTVGDFNGQADIEPDTIPSSWGRTSPDRSVVIDLYDFSGYGAFDIDTGSVRINDSMVPLSMSFFPPPPGYSGDMLEITISAREFLRGYGAITETRDFSFKISGKFLDDQPFALLGTFTIYPQSATIRVPDHWATVGEGVEAAISGDTVIVADGIYSGDGNRDISLDGKSLVIRSAAGPTMTTIDCGGSESQPHRAFMSTVDDESGTVIEGFTIVNGYFESGGGISIVHSDLTIRNCTFQLNRASDKGGALYLLGASPTIDHCLFLQNQAASGGAIHCWASSDPTIGNCTFSGNAAATNGAALYCYNSSPALEKTLIAFNGPGGAIYTLDAGSEPQFSCCDIYGNAGGDWTGSIAGQSGINGNFSADPLFCDSAGGDYHLDGLSPCLLANNECLTLLGAYGTGCGALCGDASGDMYVDIGDVVFLIEHIFHEGPAPGSFQIADLNHDDVLDIGDIMTLIDFIFRSGPPLNCQPE